MKTYNINISILAKVEDDKLQTLQERIHDALNLAVLGWADVEDTVIDCVESDEDEFAEYRYAVLLHNDYEKSEERFTGFDFFTDANGFDEQDIEQIKVLSVGSSADTGNATIFRIV